MDIAAFLNPALGRLGAALQKSRLASAGPASRASAPSFLDLLTSMGPKTAGTDSPQAQAKTWTKAGTIREICLQTMQETLTQEMTRTTSRTSVKLSDDNWMERFAGVDRDGFAAQFRQARQQAEELAGMAAERRRNATVFGLNTARLAKSGPVPPTAASALSPAGSAEATTVAPPAPTPAPEDRTAALAQSVNRANEILQSYLTGQARARGMSGIADYV